MKIAVNPDICIGCTICTQVCPKIFKMIDDKAVAGADQELKQPDESVYDAVAQCPVDAIIIKK